MFYLVFTILSLFYLCNGWFSEGFNGGADSITHFQVARFSWKHHDLLLDQWGKPVFTLLASPLAQLGFKAVVFFNIALILWGAWLSWRIASLLKLDNAWMVPFFILSAPVVMGNGVSALTEMLCSLFLIIYLYLILRNRFVWASLIVSFMPFARSEGFVVLAVLFFYYAFTRRWASIPLLAFGSIVYDVLGCLQTGQIMWIISSNPYVATAVNTYGSGSLLHFFLAAVPVFGIAFIFVLYATVIKAISCRSMFASKALNEHERIWFWVILGASWAYFAAHTWLWWQGAWASFGLTRVMFVIVVPFSLLAVYGFNSIASRLGNVSRNMLEAGVIALTIAGPFLADGYPVALGLEEQEHHKVIKWMDEHPEVAGKKIYAANYYLSMQLRVDPYDKAAYEPLGKCKKAKPGDLVLWDAHFGPNEHQVPLTTLTQDSSFVLLEKWAPERKFSTLKGYDFELWLFKKK